MFAPLRHVRSIAISLLLLGMASSPAGLAAELDSAGIHKRIDAAFAEIDRSGSAAIVAYSVGGGRIVVREFGRLMEDGIPASQMQVDLLSITKSVTAISILKLVEREDLRLIDTIDSLFANVPDDKAAITVHQLLTHSSGLLDSCGDDHEQIDKNALLKCAFDSDLRSLPGTEYLYSNVGFSILAAIVEERSGKSFENFLMEEVLRPAGLTNTGYASVIDDRRSMQSAGGDPISVSSWGGQQPYWNLIGNGGLISTAEEFIRLRRALATGEIVSLDLLAKAHTAHVAEDAEGTSYYGYGVVVQERSDVGPLLWHNGGSGDFSSEWSELVDRDVTLFVAGLQLDDANAYSVTGILRRHLQTQP